MTKSELKAELKEAKENIKKIEEIAKRYFALYVESQPKVVATFYIDVGNIAAYDIPTYMERIKSLLRRDDDMDKFTVNIVESYFIPVRNGGSRIEFFKLNNLSDADLDKLEKVQKEALQKAQEKSE